jgi:hypothetical protein
VILGADQLVAANSGPAMHIALLGIVVAVGLIVFAVVRVQRRRESAEADQPDQPAGIGEGEGEQPERSREGQTSGR